MVSQNSINDIHTDMGVPSTRMRLVPVGVDPDLFRPLDHVQRVPGRLITTASADVALEGPLVPHRGDGQAAHRARREPDGDRQTQGRQDDGAHRATRPDARTSSSCPACADERIVELYAEAELAVVPSLYEGFSLPAIEAMCSGTALVATDGGALPEVTGKPTATRSSRAGPATPTTSPRRSRAGSTTPSCAPAVAANGRQRVLERWTWRRCAEQTVEQYREVLAMPANVAKLARNGRI